MSSTEVQHKHGASVTDSGPTVLPPCPSWCTVATGRQHGYDEFTDVDDLTPHQAREFAARLLASAAKIGELTA